MEIRIKITWKRIAVMAVVAVVICATVWAWVFIENYPANNFAVVKEGVLYRSGQPGRFGWSAILDDYGIKTVVSVRELDPDADWFQYENEVCEKRSIPVIRMPVGYVSDADVVRFMDIMNRPGSCPVLVHCEYGSTRTGVIVAAYRIIEDGWSYAQALKEAKGIFFNAQRNTIYTSYLMDLEKRLDADPGLRQLLRSGKMRPVSGKKSKSTGTKPADADS